MWLYIFLILIITLLVILSIILYYSDYEYVIVGYGSNKDRPCRHYYRRSGRKSIKYYQLSDKDISFSNSLKLIDEDSGERLIHQLK